MKVAIYARVSTSDQNAESQLTALREFASNRNFEIYQEYVDQVTGVISKRKPGQGEAYKRLMADARWKRFDIVLVWKFDRFARSLQSLIEALKLFQSLKIDFISCTQNIDTTTPMGVFFFQVVGAFAELEREMIVERVRAGVANARAKGVKIGRPRKSTNNDEQLILAEWKGGASLSELARKFNRSRAGIFVMIERFKSLASTGPGASNGGLAPRDHGRSEEGATK